MSVTSADLTVVYYTANVIRDGFAKRIREHLRTVSAAKYPILCVSQKPLVFGNGGVVLGNIGATTWNCYQQMLRGARMADTPYVAMAEDDCLYTAEHFDMRPTPGVFRYNKSRWWVEPKTFRWRDRTGMHTCICERELLIDALEKRFAKAKQQPDESAYRAAGWGEPGRYEKNLGLPRLQLEYVYTDEPVLTFNHRDSLGGRRAVGKTDRLEETLEPWGRARDVWRQYVDA